MGRTQRRRKKRWKFTEKHNGMSKILNLQKALRLKCPNIQINYFSEFGWGLRCKRRIKKGDLLIALPLHHLITPEVSCDIFSILKVDDQTPQLILSIFLIYESHLNEISKYYEYIESLPNSFTNPYFCVSDEVNLLPESIKKEVVVQSVFVDNFIENLFKIISYKSCPHCRITLKNIFTREKCVWAWFIVNTRSVYYEDIKLSKSLALAPFLDLFNHSNDTETKMSIDLENRLYILKTNNSFKKFEQVFIKYGNHTNLKLFLEYGFILPKNLNDFVEFSFKEILEIVKEIDVKFGKITTSKFKLIESHKLDQNLIKNSEFSWNLIGLIYVLITAEQNLSVLQSKIYSNSFIANENILIQKISEIILQKRCSELKQSLLKMKAIENCTPSFQIAKKLIQSYINLLL